ncbi:hypothetical protein MOTC310_15680 [Methylobacterium oryzae]|uniref:Uncharacterized protein n=1 Tax=Methylobacterium oryzae TaxID=334852 RepID=A0ABU7TQD0_9HYPH
MMVETRILVAKTLPPLTLPYAQADRARLADPLPRLRRLVCVVAALTLPVLGVAVAETVHRASPQRAPQAAAPVFPSDGAAAPSGATSPRRAARAVRIAARPDEVRWVRS